MHTILEGAGVSEKVEGRRSNGEGLRASTGTGGAFLEGHLDTGAGCTRDEGKGSGVTPVLGIG